MWSLAGATLVNRAGSMVLAFLVLFLTKERGFTDSEATLIFGLYGVVTLAMAPLSGWLSDKVGPTPLLKASLLLGGLAFLAYPFARGTMATLLATVALACLSEPFRPASMALIANTVAPEKRKQAFVLQRLAINLGFSVGPILGGFLAAVNYESLFWVNGGASLIAFLVLLRLPASAPAPVNAELATPAWKDRRFLWFLLACLIAAVVFFQHQAPLSVFMVKTLGLTEAHYGLIFTVNTLMIVLLEVRVNGAMAGWPHHRALALGALLAALGFGALGFCTGAWSILATVPLWTFAEMIMFPTMSTYVADIAPKGRTGAYMGAYAMSFGLAFTISPKIGVTLLQDGGPMTLWLSMGALGLVSVALFLRMNERPPVARVCSSP